jgi:hypothetical protein
MNFIFRSVSKTDIRVPVYPPLFKNASAAKALRLMQKDLLQIYVT